MTVKVNLSLNEDLMKRIDEYADSNFMSRSAFVAQCCNQCLNQYEVINAIKVMSSSIRRISEIGTFNDEVKAQFEELEKVAKFLTGQV